MAYWRIAVRGAAGLALIGILFSGRASAETVGFDSGRWALGNADTLRVEGQLAMDGFAVTAANTFGASADAPRFLAVRPP